MYKGLLVTASKDKNNKFKYNPITVVLMTELLKLLASGLIYLKDFSIAQMWYEMKSNQKSK
jgi:solute carrier family 35 (UDP-sugar transporter), member A1/2/3